MLALQLNTSLCLLHRLDKSNTFQWVACRHSSKLCDHSGSNRFICNVCGDSVIGEQNINVHLKRHYKTTEKQQKVEIYRCPHCPKKYWKKFGLTRHLQTHKFDSLKCDLCPREFTTEDYLQQHKEEHKLKKFCCKGCHKRYSLRGSLTEHERYCVALNPNIQRYPCQECNKDFKNPKNLRKHRCIAAQSN